MAVSKVEAYMWHLGDDDGSRRSWQLQARLWGSGNQAFAEADLKFLLRLPQLQ